MVLVGLVVAAFFYYVLPVIVKAVRAIQSLVFGIAMAVVVALVAVWFGYIDISSLWWLLGHGVKLSGTAVKAITSAMLWMIS